MPLMSDGGFFADDGGPPTEDDIRRHKVREASRQEFCRVGFAALAAGGIIPRGPANYYDPWDYVHGILDADRRQRAIDILTAIT